jgi:hypothetical protein
VSGNGSEGTVCECIVCALVSVMWLMPLFNLIYALMPLFNLIYALMPLFNLIYALMPLFNLIHALMSFIQSHSCIHCSPLLKWPIKTN